MVFIAGMVRSSPGESSIEHKSSCSDVQVMLVEYKEDERQDLTEDERSNRQSNPGDTAFVHKIGTKRPTQPPGKAKIDQGHPGGGVSSWPTQEQQRATLGRCVQEYVFLL